MTASSGLAVERWPVNEAVAPTECVSSIACRRLLANVRQYGCKIERLQIARSLVKIEDVRKKRRQNDIVHLRRTDAPGRTEDTLGGSGSMAKGSSRAAVQRALPTTPPTPPKAPQAAPGRSALLSRFNYPPAYATLYVSMPPSLG
jgi:hypothetical protein